MGPPASRPLPGEASDLRRAPPSLAPSYLPDTIAQLGQLADLADDVGALPRDLSAAIPRHHQHLVLGPVFTAHEDTILAGASKQYLDEALAECWVVYLPDPQTLGFVKVLWRGGPLNGLTVFASKSLKFPRLTADGIKVTNTSSVDLIVQVFALRNSDFGVGADISGYGIE